MIWTTELEWNRKTRSWEQVLERIMAKIEMVTESGCWIWTGANKGSKEPYGRVYFCGRQFSVHKLVYELLKGPVPKGLVLDHLCRVEPCANPDHQEPVTDKVNIYRGHAPGILRMNSLICINGHEWNEDNTRRYEYDNGRISRFCRSCERERSERRRRGARMDI
jgi:HNH endonuclease